MDSITQMMYWVGTLATLVVSLAVFLQCLRLKEEQDANDWREQWKEQIETIGQPTQSVSG